jgi:hypothetical protein
VRHSPAPDVVDPGWALIVLVVAMVIGFVVEERRKRDLDR